MKMQRAIEDGNRHQKKDDMIPFHTKDA